MRKGRCFFAGAQRKVGSRILVAVWVAVRATILPLALVALVASSARHAVAEGYELRASRPDGLAS